MALQWLHAPGGTPAKLLRGRVGDRAPDQLAGTVDFTARSTARGHETKGRDGKLVRVMKNLDYRAKGLLEGRISIKPNLSRGK